MFLWVHIITKNFSQKIGVRKIFLRATPFFYFAREVENLKIAVFTFYGHAIHVYRGFRHQESIPGVIRTLRHSLDVQTVCSSCTEP